MGFVAVVSVILMFTGGASSPTGNTISSSRSSYYNIIHSYVTCTLEDGFTRGAAMSHTRQYSVAVLEGQDENRKIISHLSSTLPLNEEVPRRTSEDVGNVVDEKCGEEINGKYPGFLRYTNIAAVIEHTMREFATWQVFQLGSQMSLSIITMLTYAHPESLVTILSDQGKDSTLYMSPQHKYEATQQVLQQTFIHEAISTRVHTYRSHQSINNVLPAVTMRHPGPALFLIFTDDVKDASSLLMSVLSLIGDESAILLFNPMRVHSVIQRRLCELRPWWRIYRHDKTILLKSPTLLKAKPLPLPPLPSLISSNYLSCTHQNVTIDVILLTKNRPLQTLAFLESLVAVTRGINTVWIIQHASTDEFASAYAEVVRCIDPHVKVNILDEGTSRRLGLAVLKALTDSLADYIIFAVDEIIWIKPVDLNLVGCLLRHGGDDVTSFQLRLGETIKVGSMSITEEKKRGNFVPLTSNSNIMAFYPLHLPYDFGYVLHMDAPVVARQRVLQDIGESLRHIATPAQLEGHWLRVGVDQASRKWHLMYRTPRLVNNQILQDGRVAGATILSQGSHDLLKGLIKHKQKINITHFISKYADIVQRTHEHFEVKFTNWECV